MNANHPDNAPRAVSLHFPLSFLGLAAAVFLTTQIQLAERSTETARWQLSNLEKQSEAMNVNQKKLGELITSGESQVKLAETVQSQYTALLEDVLALADTDADARKFVGKWQLKRNEAKPAAEPAASPAPGL